MEKELLNSKIKLLYQEQKSKYVCNVCGYASTHESSAINHVTVHLKELKYSCSKCAFTAKTKDYMNKHIRKFTGETQKEYNHRIKQQPSKFKCHLCHIRFPSALEQQTHFIDQNIFCKDCHKCNFSHTKNRPAQDQCGKHSLFFKCLKCFFLGKTKRGLNIHMARKHKEPKNSNYGLTSKKLD